MSWKEDASFVGAFVRGGNWEVGLRIARNVEIGSGQGERTDFHAKARKSRVSASDFAAEAGIGRDTVRRYLAAWEWAADEGLVDHAADLSADDTYEFETSGLGQAEWKEFYEIACMNPPPWNPQGKPMDSAYGGGRQERQPTKPPSREQIAEAIKSDPASRLAAREAIELADRERTSRKPDPHGKQTPPMEQFVQLHIQLRSAKRALADALGYVIDMRGATDADEVRASVSGYVQQLRHVLDLIDEAAQGKSLDDELAELLQDEELQ